MSLKGLDMVDPLGGKPVKTERGIAPILRVAAPAAAPAPADPRTESVGQSSLASTVKELAAKPPVDLERVARIRKAIAEGSFPIYPATIADRLLALKLEWNPHDPQ